MLSSNHHLFQGVQDILVFNSYSGESHFCFPWIQGSPSLAKKFGVWISEVKRNHTRISQEDLDRDGDGSRMKFGGKESDWWVKFHVGLPKIYVWLFGYENQLLGFCRFGLLRSKSAKAQRHHSMAHQGRPYIELISLVIHSGHSGCGYTFFSGDLYIIYIIKSFLHMFIIDPNKDW